MTLRRNSKRNLHKSQEWLPRSTPLRSDGSHDGQVGRLDHVSGGQKALKTKLNLKEYYQAQVHSGQMVLVVVKQEVGPHERWLKKLKWESENDPRLPRELLKDDDNDVDDEWEPLCCPTVQQQHWVLKTLSSRLGIYSSPLISAVRSRRGSRI